MQTRTSTPAIANVVPTEELLDSEVDDDWGCESVPFEQDFLSFEDPAQTLFQSEGGGFESDVEVADSSFHSVTASRSAASSAQAKDAKHTTDWQPDPSSDAGRKYERRERIIAQVLQNQERQGAVRLTRGDDGIRGAECSLVRIEFISSTSEVIDALNDALGEHGFKKGTPCENLTQCCRIRAVVPRKKPGQRNYSWRFPAGDTWEFNPDAKEKREESLRKQYRSTTKRKADKVSASISNRVTKATRTVRQAAQCISNLKNGWESLDFTAALPITEIRFGSDVAGADGRYEEAVMVSESLIDDNPQDLGGGCTENLVLVAEDWLADCNL